MRAIFSSKLALGGFVVAVLAVGSWLSLNYGSIEPGQSGRASIEQIPLGFVRYDNPRYGFYVYYPQELEVKAYAESADTTTVVFEKDEKLGFQIFITPYAENQITRERFAKDIPGSTISNPTEIIVAEDTRALAFFSNDPLIGPAREVWLIRDGHLYEVTTYKELDEWLAAIMSTWRFIE